MNKSIKLEFLTGVLIIIVSMNANAQPRPAFIYGVQDPAGFSFALPIESYQRNDTLNIRMYSCESNGIQLEVHYINTTDHSNVLGVTLPTDTLGQFVPSLLQATNGQVVSQQTVLHNSGSIKGKEAQIRYIDDDNESSETYSRFYWFNNKMITFTITAKQQNSVLASYKSLFFNTIIFH